MTAGSALVLRADARSLPLLDASVDLIVTSPPYFALRSYIDGGEHYDGQIGSEATPQEYIANLIDCTAEWVRVLKPGGSIWVNLGDKYSGNETGGSLTTRTMRGNTNDAPPSAPRRVPHTSGLRPKSLMMLPERYRIAAVDQLGLIARAVVIWSKPNGLPESVTDRVRRSHEDWVHLTKAPRYFSAVDEIRQPHANPGKNYGTNGAGATALRARNTSIDKSAAPYSGPNPLGALPGSVWTIPTEPLTVPDHLGVDHFAAFPTEWPRRIILGWSPSGVCTVCGEGRRPVVERERIRQRKNESTDRGTNGPASHLAWGTPGAFWHRAETRVEITGESCACPDNSAPTRPAIVLDPFGGTGTTALVARALGRIGISGDRSADYCRLAQWRTTDRAQLAKAMRVLPPPKVHEAQLDLFGEVA